MFCYQCEQTGKDGGCTNVGVCGKKPDVAALQDLLVYTLQRGFGFYAVEASQGEPEAIAVLPRPQERLQRRCPLGQHGAQALDRCRGGAQPLGPGLELYVLADALLVHDPEACVGDHLAPLRHPQAAAVARVADLLESVVGEGCVAQLGAGEARRGLGIGGDVVDQRERAARLQHPPHLAHEQRDVWEMVRRDSAGDEFELRVAERQRLGIGADDLHVGEALGGGELARFGQHFLGDVAGNGAGDVRREGCCGVAGPCGYVEHLPVPLGANQFDQAGEARALGVDGGGRIGRRMGAELLLHQRFGHGCTLSRQGR